MALREYRTRPETPSMISAASFSGSVRLTLAQSTGADAWPLPPPRWWRASAVIGERKAVKPRTSASTAEKALPADTPARARCHPNILNPKNEAPNRVQETKLRQEPQDQKANFMLFCGRLRTVN